MSKPPLLSSIARVTASKLSRALTELAALGELARRALAGSYNANSREKRQEF